MKIVALTVLTNNRIKKIEHVVKNRQSGFVVVLEDIHDPHNAAAALRTCDTFGIKDVYFIFKNQDEYDPKRIGRASSSSANKWLEFKTFTSTSSCFRALKKQGYKIYVTALSKKATSIQNTNFDYKKIALVFGNEHKGVSSEALKYSDKVVMIPQLGMVQSLNISVSAAIFMYEAFKQRGGKYKLTSKEQDQLRESYKNKASKAMIKLTKLNERTGKTST